MPPPLKRIVIVGGGFAGLYAAQHLARQPVAVTLVDRKNHHTFQPLLYQVATAVLSPGEIAAPLRRILNRSPNTEVILGEVTGFDTAARSVKLAGGAELPYDVLIVAASPLGKLLAAAAGAEIGVEIDKAGRVKVAPDLSLPGHPEIFVLGDMAALVDAAGQVVPGLGAAATQEGVATARNIARDLAGKPRVPFTYRDKGSMATIGRHRAIAEIGRWHFTGTLAWLMWALIHVVLLIGFRNRLMVMSEWAWAYLTRERSARLITDLADDPAPASPPVPPKAP